MFLTDEWVDIYAREFYKSGILRIYTSPIELASGIESGIFFDARIISQFPRVRCFVLNHFKEMVEKLKKPAFLNENPDLVCSVPYGADHLAILVAEKLALPLFQFEKQPGKGGFGLNEASRKNLEQYKSRRGLMVDDVLTTGLSSGQVAEYLRNKGVDPWGLVCLVDRQRGGRESLRKKGIEVNCLLTMEAILKALTHRKEEFGIELPPLICLEEEKVIMKELENIKGG